MGSVTSRPKAPSSAIPAAQTVSAPAVAATPAATTSTPAAGSTSSATGTATTVAPTAAQVQQQERDDNLLQRDRGVLSTVLTGFRGVLDDSVAPKPQKTLLGE